MSAQQHLHRTGRLSLARFQNLNYLFKNLEGQQHGVYGGSEGQGRTSPKQLERGSQEELGSRKPGSSVPGQAPLHRPSRHPGRGHGEAAPSSPSLSLVPDFSRGDRYGRSWGRGAACTSSLSLSLIQAPLNGGGGRNPVRALGTRDTQIPGPP